MGTNLKIAANAVTAKMIDAPREAKLVVQKALSYAVDGFDYIRGFDGTGWDGRASFFNFNSGTFPAGFLLYAVSHLQKAGFKPMVVRKPLPAPLGEVNPKVDSFPEDPRYDYQAEVVEKLLRHGQMIAQVATGGGKSRIAKLCFARLRRPTLFLTTRSILMWQMHTQFVMDLGEPVGVFGDDNWTRPELMNVGMVQTFGAALALNETGGYKNPERAQAAIELLERFEFVIAEEAHELSADTFYQIMRLCKNAQYRLALTATPFMKDSEEANMKLMAACGPVAIRVSEKMLIDRGILARPFFKFIHNVEASPEGWTRATKERPSKLTKLFRSTPYQKAYEIGVVGNEARNKRITAEAIRATRYGLTVIVLVQHKPHGHNIATLLTNAGVRCNFIWGEKSHDERQAALNALKDGRIQVLIGSTILDVGVDVPAVGMVILAGAGKAEVALRQRIGRGLREKRDGRPNVCFIVDFTDPANNHLRDHARARRAIVESTEGFKEGILEGNFPFQALGFTKLAA